MIKRALVATLLACASTVGMLPAVDASGPQPVVERPFVIVIDAGHGGENTGCSAGDGTPEKAITLALALDVGDELRRRLPHAQVVFTREDDRSLTLAERVAQANAREADLFVSLHANASPDHTQTGFETYVLDAEASTRDAAWTARRENDEQLVAPGDAEPRHEAQAMVRQLKAAADRRAAVRLAAAIQAEQAERFPQRLDRGVRQAPFDVLMGARMPAVLFEAGFLDHPSDARLLKREATRRTIAEGVADAVVEHYRSRAR